MKISTVLFYKPDHNNDRCEIRYYPDVETAELVAENMISQFKYWGGGSVPVAIIQDKKTTKGYKTLYRHDFDYSRLQDFARESGLNIYGYYQYKHHEAIA